jgi:hypothetical protein
MTRFIWAAILQGLFAVLWTLFIINPWYSWFGSVAPTRMFTEGSAGSLFALGYGLYIAVGVIAVAVTGLFYYYIEEIQGKLYFGISNTLAWLHYVLLNLGVTAATWSLMFVGYQGGSYLATYGVANDTAIDYVQSNYISPWVNPISYMVAIAALGAVLGGVGYLIRIRMR